MKSNIKLMLFLVVASFSGLFAQRNSPPPPPAQGPYECEKTSNFNGGIATSFIKPILENIIEEKIEEVNSDDEKDYKIRWKSAGKTKVYAPSNQSTKRRDQPNQKYVLMPFLVQLEAYDAGPLNFERTISFNVNFKISCRNWQKGNGKAEMATELTEPVISGGTILENVLNFFSSGNLTSYINNQIQEKLKFNNNIDNFSFGNPNCDCLKIQKFSNVPPAWEISWDKKRFSIKERRFQGKSVKIDFQKIIRHKGIRTPTNLREDVAFDIWVNGKYFEYPIRRQDKIVMEEGDTRSINDFSITIPVEDRVENLQIIVVAKGRRDGTNGSRNQSTSGWSAFEKANKYGQGNRSTQTKKEIIIPPSQFNPKPSSSWVKDYELKFKVQYLDPSKVKAPIRVKPPSKKPKPRSKKLLKNQGKAKVVKPKIDN